jgi:hypothetical protein
MGKDDRIYDSVFTAPFRVCGYTADGREIYTSNMMQKSHYVLPPPSLHYLNIIAEESSKTCPNNSTEE